MRYDGRRSRRTGRRRWSRGREGGLLRQGIRVRMVVDVVASGHRRGRHFRATLGDDGGTRGSGCSSGNAGSCRGCHRWEMSTYRTYELRSYVNVTAEGNAHVVVIRLPCLRSSSTTKFSELWLIRRGRVPVNLSTSTMQFAEWLNFLLHR